MTQHTQISVPTAEALSAVKHQSALPEGLSGDEMPEIGPDLDRHIENRIDDVQGYGYGYSSGIVPVQGLLYQWFPPHHGSGPSNDGTSLGGEYDGGGSGGGQNTWWEGSDNGEHSF